MNVPQMLALLRAAGEAIQGRCAALDCFVASLLAMTGHLCVATPPRLVTQCHWSIRHR